MDSCLAFNKPEKQFYTDAEEYWSNIPATINGMLGGFGFISKLDIDGSKLFLKQLFKSKRPPDKQCALDCGAGIGRITKHLLLDFFERVDLVEQNPTFLEQAKEYLGDNLKIGEMFPVGLQDFKPESNRYDVVWVQWVTGHLTDTDLITFFKLCTVSLKPNGVIILKENITTSDEIEIDDKDSSVTRPFHLVKTIFMKASLDCFRQLKQNNFPKTLYSVYTFALRPIDCDQGSVIETK